METVEIRDEVDIVRARSAARELAEELRFSIVDKVRIATAVSELARNTLIHGGGGYMEIDKATDRTKVGIRCVFVDHGPGIPDVEQAMRDGFSTNCSLGQGLPGARRLTDDFTLETKVGEGTRVGMVKWA